MAGRKLKNYDLYLTKLELYAKAMGIKVEIKPEPSYGVFVPSRRLIRLDPDMQESDEIATFLHELGHAMDVYLTTPKLNVNLEKAYHVVYVGQPTEHQLKLVVECEKLAWENGKKIAKQLGIKLGKWYTQAATSSVRDYRKIDKQ